MRSPPAMKSRAVHAVVVTIVVTIVVGMGVSMRASSAADDGSHDAQAPQPAAYASPARPALGSAETFALLAASRVSNVGPSTLVGDIGVSPGTAITGMDESVRTHRDDASAAEAQLDARHAFEALERAPCDEDLSLRDLAFATLEPGVYCVRHSLELDGMVRLAADDEHATFVFQVPGRLTTRDGAGFELVGEGAERARVFVQVGESAFFGDGSVVPATVIAGDSATLRAGTQMMKGRVLALSGAVSLEGSHIWVSASQGTR